MASTTERSVDDTKPLTFQWPTSDATVIATVSIDNADFVDVVGNIDYLRTENGKHYYTLDYNAADRPEDEGTAKYLMTDGITTYEFILRVTPVTCDGSERPPGGVTYVPPSAADADCSEQNQVLARQTVVDGCPVLPKLQCHEIQMGQDARLLWQFKNAEGEAVNLNLCDSQCSQSSQLDEAFDAIGTPDCTVELRIREITGNCQQDKVYCLNVEIIDAPSGTVRASALPKEIVREPGIYIEEWGVFTPDKRMLFSNQCCTFVRRGLFGLESNTNKRNAGPPTLEEIRLALRDNSPTDNLLLDDIEFDSAEIAQAVVRPINFWNEIPPPIRPIQTTKTFPFREMWMLGIQAYLLETAAHHYRRNHLPYNAGGVAIDDKNKEQAYAAKSMELMQRFQEMVRAKKVEINISLFSGSIGSAYSGMFY
jgi:hypothetical protein